MRPDMQEGRLATAQRFARNSLVDNVLVHQFLDQHARYAAGNIHSPGEVSSGNRLVLANKIQRNPSIDISRRCARGYTKISGIDLSHQARSFVRSSDNIAAPPTLSSTFSSSA